MVGTCAQRWGQQNYCAAVRSAQITSVSDPKYSKQTNSFIVDTSRICMYVQTILKHFCMNPS